MAEVASMELVLARHAGSGGLCPRDRGRLPDRPPNERRQRRDVDLADDRGLVRGGGQQPPEVQPNLASTSATTLVALGTVEVATHIATGVYS